MLFLYSHSMVLGVDDMKLAFEYFRFARLVLELCAKEALERLIEEIRFP